jgi:hypothetical protein
MCFFEWTLQEWIPIIAIVGISILEGLLVLSPMGIQQTLRDLFRRLK